jgi:hypothetical protein
LLYVATHTHPAAQCPLNSEEGKTMLKQLFSDVNVKQAGIKINAAYMSCPKDTQAEHKGFFVVEADSPTAITSFFGQMAVQVREVVPFSEVAKKL